jgi:hypothetical protein
MRQFTQRIFQIKTMNLRQNIIKWLGVIALAAGVMAGTVWMLRPQMDERLYAKYRNLPQAQFLLTGDTSLAEACAAHNLKQYTKALPLFQRDTQTKYATETRFFSAICLLELNKMKEAEALLTPIVESNHPLQPESLWYTALSHLRRHDRKGCLLYLKEVETKSSRQSRATITFLIDYLQ